MIVTDTFIVVIGHTGIPDCIYALFHQCFHMTVEQLCRIAYCVGRNGVLTLEIKFTGGFRGKNNFKVQFCKESKPEGEIFIHIQPEGDAYGASGTVSISFSLHGAQLFVFIAGEIGEAPWLLT